MNDKIKSVFLAKITQEVTNTTVPVTTSLTTSKVFKTYSDVVKHKCGLYDATLALNNDSGATKDSLEYNEEIKTLLMHNNETAKLTVKKYIQDPSVSYEEVQISELTLEQKNEFEKKYDMKIIEDTFPNKTVEFKTKSKFYAIENDTSVEAQINVSETVQ